MIVTQHIFLLQHMINLLGFIFISIHSLYNSDC